MLGKLFEFLKGKGSGEVSLLVDRSGKAVDEYAPIAVLVLLVEASGRDQKIATEEAETIVELMMVHFGTPQRAVPELIKRALEERKGREKLDEIVALLNETYSDRQKLVILAMIWRLVSSDGEVESFEKRFAVQMKYRFRLSDALEAEARRLAAEGRV